MAVLWYSGIKVLRCRGFTVRHKIYYINGGENVLFETYSISSILRESLRTLRVIRGLKPSLPHTAYRLALTPFCKPHTGFTALKQPW